MAKVLYCHSWNSWFSRFGRAVFICQWLSCTPFTQGHFWYHHCIPCPWKCGFWYTICHIYFPLQPPRSAEDSLACCRGGWNTQHAACHLVQLWQHGTVVSPEVYHLDILLNLHVHVIWQLVALASHVLRITHIAEIIQSQFLWLWFLSNNITGIT